MSDIAIKFENISKQYRLGLVGTGTVSHDLNRWWHQIRGKEDPYLKIGDTNDRSSKANSKYVWALKDITFDVKQGDVVGIIGKNGAGKSTLLKILSRVTSPTTGSIKAKGRIASLLEVGTGFHPEMTGRENIYMNGAIMGMTKAEITRKLDEIVDFAGIEKYIDTPTKRYSSGMTVRLGFAIAAHLEPEILVVDEVLAVGDAEFQKKAIGKMQDVSRGDGRTVLFVSHNMTAVQNLCKTGVMLENGMLVYQGGIDSVVDRYLAGSSNSKNVLKKIEIPCILEGSRQHIQIKSVEILNDSLYYEDTIQVEIIISADMEFRDLIVGIGFETYTSIRLITIENFDNRIPVVSANKDVSVKVNIPTPHIPPGEYSLSVGIRQDSHNSSFHFLRQVLPFTILSTPQTISISDSPHLGLRIPADWKYEL